MAYQITLFGKYNDETYFAFLSRVSVAFALLP